MSFSERYVNFLHSSSGNKCGGRCVVLFMVVATIVAVPFCFKLGDYETTQFSPAPGSQSAEETKVLQTTFPNAFYDRETLYIQCTAPANCTCTKPVAEDCQGFWNVLNEVTQSLEKSKQSGTFVSMTSYFDFSSPQLTGLSFGYHNASASSMIASLQFTTENGDTELTSAVQAVLDVAAKSKDGWTMYLSGKEAAQITATKSAGKTIGMADGNGMILIVLLFAWQVRSWRLTLIPVFNTMICLIVARALIYPLAKAGAIVLPSYVPNVVLFLAIALSVDYSFFHLSRFQEVRREVQADSLEEGSPEDRDRKIHFLAVTQMVQTGGRVVLVSGVILMLCWLALAAFPVFGTDTLGYCASITIFVCIAVNLTMNPALVLIFNGFFSRSGQDACKCCRRRRGGESANGNGSLLNEEHADDDVSKSSYAKIARFGTSCPGMILIPVVVYALLLPAAIRLFDAELVVGGISGSSADTNYALSHIMEEYPSQGGGIPLTVVLSPGKSVKVDSDEYFDAGCQLAKIMEARTAKLGIKSNAFRGVMLNGRPGSDSSEVSCITWSGKYGADAQLEKGGIYAWAWSQAVNPENSSSLIAVTPPFDAFSNKARDLVTEARAAVEDFKKSSSKYDDWEVVSYHPMGVNVDAEELASSRFPWVVGATALAVFCIVGLRYRAALIPVKLFFTIALPIISILGMGVYVFQDGMLNWTGIPSLQSQGGLVWINPIACTFMLIGFGLDYDVFLFSRIYQARRNGEFIDDRSAIIDSVARTGPVITTAGCIMALAFTGMVAQHDNPFLCQMGFTMIFGVLMDTFVVRTLLVPSILAMAGKLNWWPGKMPSTRDAFPTISMSERM
eukprot:TRINITY_DN35559_c0_g1_i1.p1 TRINITY_DN35559_c0_g1~~TRINITY_DN35559_c0_g1_i1.p1  ORF type:complete len:859 (-),score=151.27 TRINITY_DN35559_c0_g1_i1:116-2653(-)